MRAALSRSAVAGLVAVSLVCYALFRLVRASLPDGALKGSFTSLLVSLLALAVIDLVPGLRFHSVRTRVAAQTGTIALLAFWLEVVVPRLYSGATGDPTDAVFMAGGVVLFWLCSVFTTRPGSSFGSSSGDEKRA